MKQDARASRSLRRRKARKGHHRIPLLFEPLEDRTLLSNDLWTGAVNSNWSNAGNWTQGVPGSTTTVEFSTGSTTATVDQPFTIGSLQIDSTWGGTLTVGSSLTVSGNLTQASGALQVTGGTLSVAGSVSASDLNVAGGTLAGSGTLAAGSQVTWSSGYVTGTLTNAGTMTVTGSGTEYLSGTLTNTGTIDVTGGGTIEAYPSAATIDNQAGALFDFQSNASLSAYESGAFNNAGTLDKTAGTGTSSITFTLNDSGTVEADSGTLSLLGGGSGTNGVINANGSGIVSWSGSYSGNFSGSGTGAVQLSNLTGTGSSGVTLDFPGSLLAWTGTLGGTVTNNGDMTSTGSGTEYLSGTLTNTGTIDVTGGGTIEAYPSAATIDNQAGALFDFQSNASLSAYESGAFNNAGTLDKTAGTGTSSITFTLNDSGTVEADSGTLSLLGGGSGTNGVINANGSGIVSWSGSYSGNFSGSGTGAVQLSNLTGTGSSGVTLDFPGSLLAWTGTLGGTVTNNGDMTSTGSGTEYLSGTLTNTGTIDVTGGGTIEAYPSAATIDNQAGALFDFQSNASLSTYESGTFNNAGTLETTASSGTTTIGYSLNDTGGTLDGLGGTLTFSGGGTITGSMIVGGTVNVTGGVLTAANGSAISPPSGGSGSLNVTGGTFSVAGTVSASETLNIAGGTLAGTGTLEAGSQVTWSSGYVTGTLTNAGAMTISGSGTEYLTGTLTNTGTIDVTGGGNISTYNSTATINNQAGALFDFESNASLSTSYDGYVGTFNNAGTLDKTVGSGTSAIGFTLNDSGTVEADSGMLVMPSSGSGTNGVINANGSGIVSWSGSYSGNLSGSGTGAVQLSNLTGTGSSGVTLDFPGSVLQWTGGDLSGTVANAGTMTITGSSTEYLAGTLTNTGTIDVTGGGTIYAYPSAATIDNEAGAIFDFQSNASLSTAEGYSGTFNNAGTLETTAGSGTTTISYSLNEIGGTVEGLGGTLSFSGGGTITGSMIVGGTVNVTGGVLTATNGSTISPPSGGSGSLNVTGGSFSVAGTVSASETLDIAGGTLTGTGTLDAGSQVTWSSGYVAGTLTNAGTMTITGSSTEYLAGTLTNTGTIDVTGGGTIYAYPSAATIDNEAGAIFDFQSNASLNSSNYGYSGTFNNAGTLDKTAGSGASAIAFTLNDSGTVEADSGTLAMPSSGSGTNGVINANGSGVVSWSGTYSGSFSGSGSGTGGVQFSNLTATGTGGVTLDFGGSVLQWTAGDLSGTVANAGNLAVSGSSEYLTGTLTNTGTIDFTGGGTIYAYPSAATIDNEAGAVFDFQSNASLNSTSYGYAGTFNNAGTLERTAGSGTATIGFALNESGTLEVDSGTISATGSITGTNATITVASGATFLMTGAYTGTFSGSGAGSVKIDGVSLGSAGMTLDFTGSTLQWSGGSLTGPVTNLGTLTVTTSGVLLSGTFTNAGSIIVDTGVTVYQTTASSGTSIINQAGATFDLQGTADLTNTYTNGSAYGPSTFSNAGTLEKSTGSGTATIAYTLNDSGTIAVDSATLDPTGTVSGTNATIAVAAGADFLMSATYGGTFSGSGPGVVQLGSLVASNLTLDITGSGAQWTATGSLTGTLTNAGSIIVDTGVTVYQGSTSSGASIINQAGATFDLQGTANLSNYYTNGDYYGYYGTLTNTGTLEKSTGSGTAILAYAFNDTGPIVVDSATLEPTGTVTGTNATITVASGADFLMSATYGGTFSGSGPGVVQLGSLVASNLTLDITGNGAQWTATGSLTGTLTNAGSIAVDTGVTVYQGSTSSGASIINQAGATFDLQGTANLSNYYTNGDYYGYYGTFTNTGTLEKSTGSGTAILTYAFNDTGPIVVDSATLEPTGTVTGTNATITVASGADFLMSATYGGTFSGSGPGVVQLGSLVASNLTLDITGSGAQWTATGSLTGTLTNAGSIIVDTGVTVYQGSTSSGASIINQAGATFDLQGTANLSNYYTNGDYYGYYGTLTNTGTLEKSTGSGTAILAYVLSNTGTVEVASNTLYQSGSFSNFSGTTLTGGTYFVSGTGQFEFAGANVATNAATIILDGLSSKIINTSSANALAGFATNAAAGQFTVQDGGSFTTGGALSNAGGITVSGGSTLTITGALTQSGGSTTLAGGTLTSTTSNVTIAGGVLGGTGTVQGNVSNTSFQVSPGATGSAGTLTIQGNYVQGTGGSLNIELGGLGAGIGYDQLVVTGTASLGGAINISTINGYVPTVGSSFQVLTFASKSGDFQTYNGLYISGQVGLLPSYTPSVNPVNLTLTSSTVINNWINPVSGDWDTASNWTYGVPVAGQSVEISYPGITVTHTQATVEPALGSLDDFANLDLTNGSITVTGTTTIETNSTPGDLILAGGSFTANGPLNIYGHLDWSSGNLTGTGAATVGSTGVANFSSGSLTIGTSMFTSNGTINLSSGILNGTLTSNGPFNWTGGTIAGSLTSDGTLTASGTGTKSVTGNLTWSSGYVTGPLTNAGTLTISGTGQKFVSGTLTNTGTIAVTGTGPIYANANNTTIANQAGATFNIEADASVNPDGYTGSSFVNAGTLEMTAATGTASVYFPVTDPGTIEVTSGTLAFQDGGSFSGSPTLAGATTLSGGTFTVADSTSLVGTGTLQVTGGTVVLAGSLTSANGLVIAGGTLTGPGTILAGSAVTWSSGYITGPLTNAGTLTISGTGQKFVSGALTNSGTIDVTGSGIIYTQTNTTSIVNQAGATFSLQAAASLNPDGATGSFSNAGTLEMTASSGTADFNIPVTDTGTIEVASGTLALQDGGSFSGSPTLAGAATLSGGTFTVADGTSLVGTGTLQVTGGTVVLAGSLTSANGLVIAGGTLTGPGTILAGSAVTWSSGYITGPLTNAGTLTISGTGQKFVSGALTNSGTIDVTGSGIIYTQTNTTSIVNQAGATFSLQAAASLNPDGATGSFSNAGTLEMTASSGTADVNISVTDTGTIEVASGTLSLQDGGSFSGSPTLLGAITLSGGTFSVADGTSLVGTGTLQVTGGTVVLAGSLTTANTLVIAGGTLTGPGTILAGSSVTWSSGSITGPLTNSGTLTVTGEGQEFISGILTNSGTIDVTGSGIIYTQTNSTSIVNQAGATFNFQAAASLNPDGATGSFSNAGTLEMTASSGTAHVNIPVTDTGTIEVASGTLALQDGGSFSGDTIGGAGSLTVGGGTGSFSGEVTLVGTINIVSGSFTLDSGSSLIGTGTLEDTGGTLALAGNLTTANVVIAGGTLTGPGTIAAGGQVTWSSGSITGPLTNSGTLTIAGTGVKYLTGTLTNTGMVAVTGTGPIYAYTNNATITNQAGATFNIEADAPISPDGSTGVSFVNAGTLEITAASGTASVAFPVTDTGTIEVTSGTLALQGGGSFSGSPTLAGATTLTGGTFTVADGTSLVGTGTLQVTGGTVVLAGSLTSANGLVIAGGTLTGTGTILAGSGVTWSSGYITGPLTNAGTLTIAGTGVKYLTGTLTNTGMVAVTGTGPIYAYTNNATITNQAGATVNIEADATISPDGSTGVSFVNAGTLEMTAASGTASISFPITNTSGTVNAQSGTLALSSSGFVSSGVVSVGPTGTLNITGPFTQTAAGSFDVVLGGSTTGLYGHAAISGTASLNGSLNISEANGFSPAAGNVFTILTYASETGQFSNYSGLLLTGSAALQPAFNAASTTLTTISNSTIAPDLRVTNLAINPAYPQSSQSVTVNWDDWNAGNGATAASWTDYVVVTNTTTNQTVATAFVPYNAATSGNLAPNGLAPQSYAFSLPNGTAGVGNLQISVTTDYYDTIPEFYPGGVGYTNNTTTITATSTLSGYPDLQVANLATTPVSPQTGGLVTVTWDDANTGTAPVTGSFVDQVTVVNTTTGQTLDSTLVPYNESSLGPIAAGGEAAQQYTFTMTDGAPGVGQIAFTVTTNYGNTIFEYNSSGTAQSNNTSSITEPSTLGAYPDLQVTTMATSPSSPKSGQSVTATWDDQNTGDAPVATSFVDTVSVVNTTTGLTLASGIVSYNEASAGPIATGGSAAQQYTFTLPNGAAGIGNIAITVTTDSGQTVKEYDSNGNPAYSNNTSTVDVTSTLGNYADLVVAPGSLAVTPVSPQSGGSATVIWNDENQGDGAVNAAFSDYVLVQKMNGQTLTTIASGYVSGNASLAAGATSAQQQFSFTLPNGAAGTGTIVVTVTTDNGETVMEYDGSGNPAYSNNTSTVDVTSTLANYADLVVAPGSLAVTPASPQSGGSATVTWNDEDQGDGAVNAAFSDYVLVQKMSGQTLTTLASGYVSGNASLGAGATSAQQQFPFTLPNGAAGTGTIVVTVTTDSGETVMEYDSNGNPAYSNNTSTIDVTSTLGNYADLVVAPGSLAVTPASPQSGGSAAVTWNDEDQGDGPVSGSYLDYVLVQWVNPDNSLTYIASGFVNGISPLAAGATGAQRSFSFTMPDGAAGVGNFRVTVTTDDYQSIVEYDSNGNAAYTNNTTSINTTSTLGNYADLILAPGTLAVTPNSPQSGGSAAVTWNDKNQGDAAVNAAFSDCVLVQKVNGSTLTTIASGIVSGNLSLAAGATSGTQSFPFTLPNGTAGTGDIRVTVTTDYYQTVKEYDSSGNLAYSNNTTSTDVTSTLAPSPDLIVQSIVVDGGSASPVNPSQTIPVTWIDDNQGTAAANGTWLDQVFLASNAAGTQNLQLLASVNVSDDLAAGGSLAESTNITVPATDVGNKYVVVETGLSESFFEFDTANNTTVSSSAFTIPPSLQVSLAAPGNATFNKNTINPASSATVTRNDTNVGTLTVTMTSSDPAAVLLSATPGGTPAASINVVIPNGSYSAVFYVDAVQDNVVDGTRTSVISPSAPGYLAISATATELETNAPALSLTLASTSFTESAGTTATLTRNVNPANPLDTALTVTVTSSDPSVATAPATVTIPAGQNSVTFPITAVSTTLLVATRSVIFTTNTPVDPVTGRVFAASAATATVTDANTPVLELATDAPYVEENAANPATYATLSLTDGHGDPFPLISAITVALSSNDTADLTLPATVTVPAGTTSVRIPITVIDNPNNDNPVVTIAAYALDAITSQPISVGHATTTLSVLSTNGPSLSITAPTFIGVAAGEASATVSLGNTPTQSDLTVLLTSNNTGEAIVPTSVVIPAGSTSAPFNITVPSGASAGPVTISASASGWNLAAHTVTITTASLPDLTVTSVTPPVNPQAGESGVRVSWRVTNDGNTTATGEWNDHVVLSADPAGQNVIFSQNIAYPGGPLTVGSSYTGTTTFNVPSQVGVYYLTVTTNFGSQAISEITTSNDSLVSALSVGVAYYATLHVQSNEKEVPVGSPLSVSGTVTDTDGVTHPAGAIVYIAVYQNGKPYEEAGPIVADSDGDYEYTFESSPSNPADQYLNAGDYEFFALTDGQTPAQAPSQATDTAAVLGMSAAPSLVSMSLVPGTPLEGTITFTNESSVPLTNLVVTSVNEGTGSQALPISVAFVINNPAELPGTTTTPGQLTATYTLTATEPVAVSGAIFVTVNDDQGVAQTIELEPTITPPTPRLTATSLSAGVVVGTDTLESFTLTNSGSASSGAITIVSPVNWITPASEPAPLAPGQSEQVEMLLAPAEDQALGEITGTIGVDYGSTGVPVSFTIDVVSDQHGSVQVVVDDETTTLTETGGHLAGATVQIINPLTEQPVASGTTTSTGVTLTDVTAGTYEIEVTAPEHSPYTSAITVQPGTNTADVFLSLDAVTYNFTVVPTTITDTYTIQLQADFITQVPIPNLVPATPLVMPLVSEDGSVEFMENVTNEGLIEATNVQISAVSNGTFTLTPLVSSIAVLPAQSEYAIPVELTANPGETVQDYLHSTDCCNLPELDISYSYQAAEAVEQYRDMKIDPVFATADHYAAIQSAWGANSPSFSSLASDLFNSPNAPFIEQVLAETVNPGTTDFQGNPLGDDLPTLEQNLLSALANGLTGPFAQVATDASQLLSGICDLTNNPPSTGGTNPGSSGTGSSPGSGSGPGTASPGVGGAYPGNPGSSTEPVAPSYTPITVTIPTSPSLTAQVRVEIDQYAVLTRDAFEGTLTIDNSADTGLSDIQVHLDIETDPGENGTPQEATDDFFVETPQLAGFAGNDDGSFSLGGGSDGEPAEGMATYTIIPSEQAALTEATKYSVGGTLSYTEADGTVISVPLLPTQITVEPSPNLVLNYFWQQQVEGQDALTPAVVQPSVPFPLGLEVTNEGYGTADNLSITTAQPTIIENAQGLLVGFDIIGTTVDGLTASSSLTANFGDIGPGDTGTAAFIMESTLAGYFENFVATYENESAEGGEETSLINSVEIHNLVAMVEAGYVGDPATVPATGQPNPVPDDGIQDFLTSDLPGSLGQPDTLYQSNGTTAPVATASDVSVTQVSGHTYQITADMPAGWGYFSIPDPTGGNLEVSQVARPDGLYLIVANPNVPGSAGDVWNTVQNITSNGFVTAQNDLHLLDYNATAGTITYTITYINPNAVTPQITELQSVTPSTVSTAVGTLDVTFNEAINLATFTAANLSLTLNGGSNLIDNAVSIALVSGSTYQISGLASLTTADGDYVFSASAVGVEDNLGDVGTGSVSESWTMDSVDTNVTVENATPPTGDTAFNTPVTDITVVFSNPIEQPTFTTDDLSLTLNGGSNLITSASGVTITNVSGGTYDVTLPSSLTTAEGGYEFSINAAGAGILDASGNPVVGTDFTDWTMDTTAPVITSIQQPQSPRNIVVSTLTVTFSKPINPATFSLASLTLTRTVDSITTGNLLDSRVTITPDTDPLASPNTYIISNINFPQSLAGTYTFTISNQSITDFAGNALSSPASVSWVIDLSIPAAPINLAISPDEGPNPNDGDMSELTNSQTVTFSGSVDTNTVEVRLEDLTTSTYYGDAVLAGQAFSATLNLAPGLHELSAQAFDLAGNGSIVSTYELFVDVVPPTINSLAPIVPNPPASPINTETVVLNKTVKTFSYTALSLTLNGNPVALNASVTVAPVSGDAVPTYQIAGLAPFTTASGTYVLTVNASAIVDYANNTGTGSTSVSWTQVQNIADLTVTNTVDNASPHGGSVINFTVTVTDSGPANATDISVLDLLPSGLTLESAAGPGSYNTTTGVWSISQVNADSSATLTLTASVNLGTSGETLKTVATITGLDQTDDGTPTSAEKDVTVAPLTVIVAQPPAGVLAGNPFGLTVDELNAQNQIDTSYNGSVTVSLANDQGESALGGMTTVQAVNGVATFTGLTIRNPGLAYTLQASALGGVSTTTSSFDVAGYELVPSGTTENLVWYGTSGSDQVQFTQPGAGTVQITVSELGGIATSNTATVTGVTGNVVVNEYDVSGDTDVVDGSGLTTISSVITVGNGNNTVIGGGGANTIVAGNGANTIYGNGMGNSPNASGVQDPSNTISVGNGNNIIYGNYGGSGYQGGNNTITAGDGNNTIYGNYGNGGYTGDGAEGSDNTITVGNGANTIYGNYGTADGGEGGSNTIVAGNGNDIIYGNADGDDPKHKQGSNFIQVGNGDDTIYGNLGGDGGEGGNNTILTGSGTDTIYGNFGGDGGEGGNNLIVAGGGNDTIYAHCGVAESSTTSGTTAEGQDLIIGGTGADTVYGWPAGYTLGSNTGDLFIAGTTNLSLSALDSVLAEWDSSDSYATRIADLSGQNGAAGSNGVNYLIPDMTVFGSAAVDQIFGTVGSDDDWYLVTSSDQLNNVNAGEVTLIPIYPNQTGIVGGAVQIVPQSTVTNIVFGTLSTITTSSSSSQAIRPNTNSGG